MLLFSFNFSEEIPVALDLFKYGMVLKPPIYFLCKEYSVRWFGWVSRALMSKLTFSVFAGKIQANMPW